VPRTETSGVLCSDSHGMGKVVRPDWPFWGWEREPCVNGTIDFFEVKRDAKAIDLSVLETKVARFLEKHPEKSGLARRYLGLSLADM